MKWIEFGIENPSKSEVIDRCGGVVDKSYSNCKVDERYPKLKAM